jgi:hypothetical protein
MNEMGEADQLVLFDNFQDFIVIGRWQIDFHCSRFNEKEPLPRFIRFQDVLMVGEGVGLAAVEQICSFFVGEVVE